MEQLFSLLLIVILLIIGFFFGTTIEKRHYRSIIHREAKFRHLVVLPQRFPALNNVRDSRLVSGNVVISVDYFKRFLATLRMLFGGRLGSYESLLDRARREAILRLQAQADALNATAVYNLKFETSSISKGADNTIGSIEVLAYGTALICDPADAT